MVQPRREILDVVYNVGPPEPDPVKRILDAAEVALSLNGEIRMQAIASQAGVSLATLYDRFPSKEALVLRLCVGRLQRGVHVMKDQHLWMASPDATPGERLADYLLRSFRAAQREPAVASAVRLADRPPESPQIQQLHLQLTRLSHDLAVTAAVGDGPGLGPAAETIVSYPVAVVVHGFSSWANGTRSGTDVRRAITFSAQIIDIPAPYTTTLLANADRLAEKFRTESTLG